MPTSGSIDFNLTRDDIITEALELLGVLAEGESPSAAQLTSCSRTLNMLIKHWQARGTNLFAVQRLYLFLEDDQRQYKLGLDNSNSARSAFGDDFNQAELTADAAAAATTLTVDDSSGMAIADEIGILTANGLHWDTVAAVPTSTTVDITTGLDAAATSGATIYSFTTRASRPRRIRDCVVSDKSGTETPVEVIERRDYVDLSIKTTSGRVNQLYYDPLWKTSNVFVWPITNIETDYLIMRVERTREDMDAGADDLDFPQEWYWAIATNLAIWLAPKYGASEKTKATVGALAAQALFDAEAGDTEERQYYTPDDRWDYPGKSSTY